MDRRKFLGSVAALAAVPIIGKSAHGAAPGPEFGGKLTLSSVTPEHPEEATLIIMSAFRPGSSATGAVRIEGPTKFECTYRQPTERVYDPFYGQSLIRAGQLTDKRFVGHVSCKQALVDLFLQWGQILKKHPVTYFSVYQLGPAAYDRSIVSLATNSAKGLSLEVSRVFSDPNASLSFVVSDFDAVIATDENGKEFDIFQTGNNV